MSQQNLSSLIWSVADLLRGDYRQSEYGRVILPFTVLRRLDCVLEPTKADVVKEREERNAAGLNPDPFLRRKSGCGFYNGSSLDMRRLMGDQDNIGPNLLAYIEEFSPEVKDVFDRFAFSEQIDRLTKSKLLYLVTEKFAGLDLHPTRVTNMQMGLAFEELIRKFAKASNDTAGEHYAAVEARVLASDTLSQQAQNNSEEQFANSPDLPKAVTDAVIDAHGAFAEMSRQYFDDPKVQNGLIQALLRAGGVWAKLRQGASP